MICDTTKSIQETRRVLSIYISKYLHIYMCVYSLKYISLHINIFIYICLYVHHSSGHSKIVKEGVLGFPLFFNAICSLIDKGLEPEPNNLLLLLSGLETPLDEEVGLGIVEYFFDEDEEVDVVDVEGVHSSPSPRVMPAKTESTLVAVDDSPVIINLLISLTLFAGSELSSKISKAA